MVYCTTSIFSPRHLFKAVVAATMLTLAMTLSACQGDSDTTSDDETDVELPTLFGIISQQVEDVTRMYIGSEGHEGEESDNSAAGLDMMTAFHTGDSIYASLSFEHDGMTHPYRYTGGGIFASLVSPLKFNASQEGGQHLIAFYRGDYNSTGGHVKQLRPGYTFAVPTNQSTENGTKATPGFLDGEFLYAHADVTNENMTAEGYPKLTFKHKTARIILRVHLIDDTAVDANLQTIGTKYKAENCTDAYIGCTPVTGTASTTTVPTVSWYGGSAQTGVIYTNSVITLYEDKTKKNDDGYDYGNMVLTVKNTSSDSKYRNVIKALRRQKSSKEIWFTAIFPPQEIKGCDYYATDATAGVGFFDVVFKVEGDESAKHYRFPLLLTRTFEEGKAYFYDVHIGSHMPNSGI